MIVYMYYKYVAYISEYDQQNHTENINSIGHHIRVHARAVPHICGHNS